MRPFHYLCGQNLTNFLKKSLQRFPIWIKQQKAYYHKPQMKCSTSFWNQSRFIMTNKQTTSPNVWWIHQRRRKLLLTRFTSNYVCNTALITTSSGSKTPLYTRQKTQEVTMYISNNWLWRMLMSHYRIMIGLSGPLATFFLVN